LLPEKPKAKDPLKKKLNKTKIKNQKNSAENFWKALSDTKQNPLVGSLSFTRFFKNPV
jgi:hypothetical protein